MQGHGGLGGADRDREWERKSAGDGDPNYHEAAAETDAATTAGADPLAPLTPDAFAQVDDNSAGGEEGGGLADQLFRTQPRLVPMALVWMAPLMFLVIGWATNYALDVRLEDVTGAASGWRLGFIVVVIAPFLLVTLLPAVQRRHLHRPEPFYAYCKWSSIAIATAYPVLATVLWVFGPGNPMGRSAPIFFAVLLLGTAAALFPWASRLNHAAWLRAHNYDAPERA